MYLYPMGISIRWIISSCKSTKWFYWNITIEQLRQIFLAGNVNTKWSDINPEWPEETTTIYSPGYDSDTFDLL